VNTAALSDALLDFELFGLGTEAFTGAESDRAGKISDATGGTLLLDDIENLSPGAQVRLLRILDGGRVYVVGDDRPRDVDIRLMATTRTDLAAQVRAGRMREDFYFRIVVLTVHIPPLRERREDIPLLVSHFLRRSAKFPGGPTPIIPKASWGEMLAYAWPGNVRELKNSVERMTARSSGGFTAPFEPGANDASPERRSAPASQGRLRKEIEQTEKSVIEAALITNRGKIAATSRALGISRKALCKRMQKYGLARDDFGKGPRPAGNPSRGS
jgi:DNA-binding NtrC family response regulator